MPTIWEKLTGKTTPPPTPTELKLYNPLGLKIGNPVKIATLELEDLTFVVQQLEQVVRTINGNEHKFTDYHLLARPYDGKPVRKKLRLVPLAEPDGQKTHSVLLLDLLDEFEYNEDFHRGLSWEKNNGEFKEGDAMYWRVDDIHEPWIAGAVTLADWNNDGKIEDSEAKEGSMTYWDFWRETGDGGGNKVLEFYIVEMNGRVLEGGGTEGSGQFRIWVGREIDQSRVSF